MKTKELIKQLEILTRRWRRNCGRAGGACVLSEQMRLLADEARKDCARDIENLIEDPAFANFDLLDEKKPTIKIEFESEKLLEYFKELTLSQMNGTSFKDGVWKVKETLEGFEDYKANN